MRPSCPINSVGRNSIDIQSLQGRPSIREWDADLSAFVLKELQPAVDETQDLETPSLTSIPGEENDSGHFPDDLEHLYKESLEQLYRESLEQLHKLKVENLNTIESQESKFDSFNSSSASALEHHENPSEAQDLQKVDTENRLAGQSRSELQHSNISKSTTASAGDRHETPISLQGLQFRAYKERHSRDSKFESRHSNCNSPTASGRRSRRRRGSLPVGPFKPARRYMSVRRLRMSASSARDIIAVRAALSRKLNR